MATASTGYGPDREVLVAAGGGLGDYPFDETPPNAPATEIIGDDDRLDLAAGPAIEQAGKTDNPAIEIGHPGCRSFWHSEIVVKPAPGIVALDRGVPVQPPVMLGQLRPQRPASGIVSRRVVADAKRRTRQFTVLHGDRLPDRAG